MLIEENKPLAPFTTLGIGGPAHWFVEAASEEEIAEAAAWAGEQGAPLFVLGGGSNLLVADAGFNGLVLRVGLRGIAGSDAQDQSGQKIYRAAAGEDWEHCVQQTLEDNCAGLECLSGIPGTVGGTPVQNVGAYGQEVASVIERVRAFDLREHAFVEFTAAECGFAYRRSRFNSADRGRYVVTRVDYRLTPGGAPTVRYAELQRALAEGRAENLEGREASLAEVAAVVRRIRQIKGMLLVEGDPGLPQRGELLQESCGERGAGCGGLRRGGLIFKRKGPAAFSGWIGRGESGPVQGAGRVADRAGRVCQRDTGWGLQVSLRGTRWRWSILAARMRRRFWRWPRRLLTLSRHALEFGWRWSR